MVKIYQSAPNPNACFDRADSTAFPGEKTLACPDCHSTNIWMVGKNLRGEGTAYTECRACGFRVCQKEG